MKLLILIMYVLYLGISLAQANERIVSRKGSESLNFSLRRCLLLPIQTIGKYPMASQLYRELEQTIKKLDLCEQTQNTDLFSLLESSRDNLGIYLNDKDVLKQLALISRSGLIIRITAVPHKNEEDYFLKMDVLLQDGQTILFSKQKKVKFKSFDYHLPIFLSWVAQVESFIPYDSRIIEAIKNRFLIEQNYLFEYGKYYEVEILRPINHSLKEYAIIGQGVLNLDKEFGLLGTLSASYHNETFKVGDWIRIKEREKKTHKNKAPLEVRGREMNHLAVGFQFGFGDSGIEYVTTDTNDKVGGLIWGVHAHFDYWATENLAFNFEFSKIIDSYGSKNRSIRSEFYGEPSQTRYYLSYLLPNFTSISYLQIKVNFGIKETTYNHETLEALTSHEIKGWMLGLQFKYRLKSKGAIAFEFNNLLSGEYEEINPLLGQAQSTTNQDYKISFIHRPYDRNRYGSFYFLYDVKKSTFANSNSFKSKEILGGYDLHFDY